MSTANVYPELSAMQCLHAPLQLEMCVIDAAVGYLASLSIQINTSKIIHNWHLQFSLCSLLLINFIIYINSSLFP